MQFKTRIAKWLATLTLGVGLLALPVSASGAGLAPRGGAGGFGRGEHMDRFDRGFDRGGGERFGHDFDRGGHAGDFDRDHDFDQGHGFHRGGHFALGLGWGFGIGPDWVYGPGWGWGYYPPAYYDHHQLGKIELEKVDSHDAVYINGAYAGQAKDVKHMYLYPGSYKIVVEHGGQVVLDRTVYVVVNSTLKIRVGDRG
jgi:hypothetical protein